MYPKRLKEDNISTDKRGRPDLSQYKDSPEYYVNLYEQYLDSLRTRSPNVQEAQLAYRQRVHAIWGLIANGAKSIPFASQMIKSSNAESREDGAAILAEIGNIPEALQIVLEALTLETDVSARDSLILALGAMKNRSAIPTLAKFIRDENTDEDTRWTAVESLGRIVHRQFLRQKEPIQVAIAWLDKHKM